MAIDAVRIFNVRNLIEQEIKFKSKNIYLIGENGQGKTNLLEALYLICYGRSFRERQDKKIISFGQSNMAVKGNLSLNSEDKYEIILKYKDNKKQIFFDTRLVKDRKELIYASPCIIFSHDDINYVRGPVKDKRHLINQILGLYDSVYLDSLRNYNKTVRIKNQLLKQRHYDLIPLYHQQIAEYGMELQIKRKNCLKEFNKTLSALFNTISEMPGKLFLEYNSSWKNCENKENAINILNNKIENDKKYFTSTSGPHRDRIIVKYDDRDFSSFASTGQTRLIALLLKVAQAKFFTAKTKKLPMLLLDDVFLEMDPKRKEKFMHIFPAYEQAFFTFLPGEQLLDSNAFNAQSFVVNNGEIKSQ